MSVSLPRPPRGIDYPQNPAKWAREMEDWARVSAGLLEDESRLVDVDAKIATLNKTVKALSARVAELEQKGGVNG